MKYSNIINAIKLERSRILGLMGVFTLLFALSQSPALSNLDVQNTVYVPYSTEYGSWNPFNRTNTACVSPDTIVTASQDSIVTHHQWDQPQLDPLILNFSGNDFSTIQSIDNVSLTFYWYAYSYAGFGIDMKIGSTMIEVTPFINPDDGLTVVWVYDTFDITNKTLWNQSVLENFALEIRKTVHFDNSIGIDYVALTINGNMNYTATSEVFGSWINNRPAVLTCPETQNILSEVDGAKVTHEWTQNSNDNNPLEIAYNLDNYSQIDEITLQFYWYAYSYAGFGVEVYVDNTWKTVTDYINPDPGLTVVWVYDSFDILSLSNWDNQDFMDFRVRIVKSTYFDNTIGIDQVLVNITGTNSDVVTNTNTTTVTDTDPTTVTDTDTTTEVVTDTTGHSENKESTTANDTSTPNLMNGGGTRTPSVTLNFPYYFTILFLPILVAIRRKKTEQRN